MPAPVEKLCHLLPVVEGRPDAMIALARQFDQADARDIAVDLCVRALDIAPDGGEVRAIAAELLSKGAPDWHFGIVRDQIRNDAYDAALRRAVTPDCLVLEIGTGSGLLAMMAARAGARVITCEMDPAVARLARDVIAANGLADRITVVQKHSSALDLDADLGGVRAEILVSEIVSNDLLGEGALPAHEAAVPKLLRPGAAVIPARGHVRVALVENTHWARRRMPTVSGFDLAPFSRAASPFRRVPVGSPRLTLRSPAQDLFAFDFGSGGPWGEGRNDLVLRSDGGKISGVIQWIVLDMDDEGRYENQPGDGAQSCWVSNFWHFDSEIETMPGETIAISGWHGRTSIRIWKR